MAFGGKAILVAGTDLGIRACASAARISTTGGGAEQLFRETKSSPEKDIALVRKVLASGHQSVFEHQSYCVAFEDVSVAVEQFAIEFRLGSFTVKSRRYVDFSGAGYVVPDDLPDDMARVYRNRMESLFALYGRLLEAGVPREDARFVLPYCFRSNFYMTMNARELTRFLRTALWGRGSGDPELHALAQSLAEQFERLWPGVLAADVSGYGAPAEYDCKRLTEPVTTREKAAEALLTFAEPDAEARLRETLAFTGREGLDVAALLRDERPRELEFLQYGFLIRDVSLACVTHFTRHRMLSILVPDVRDALAAGGYVLPASVRDAGAIASEYAEAFDAARADCAALLQAGMPAAYAKYFCLSGMTMPLKIRMNARELSLFLRLRTCERAQWEIRALARAMLRRLRESAPGLFDALGPGCKVYGKCTEGRLSCGHPPEI